MILEQQGDLLAVNRGILVHGCNAQGVMGGGIALAIRRKWPEVFREYRNRYNLNGLKLGQLIPVVVASDPARKPVIIVANAITQQYFGRDQGSCYVDYAALERAFVAVRQLALDYALPVHFPLIGCGLGGGKWEDVAPCIERALGDVDGTLWTLD